MDGTQNNNANQQPVGPKNSFGPMIGIIVIIIILIIGALYFWGSRPSNDNALTNDLGAVGADLVELGTEELDALEAELDTELNSL